MASYPTTPPRTLDPAGLRAAFDAVAPLTLGIEEEAMLLDPASLALLPRAAEVIDALDGDPRFTLELPASQLEIVLQPVTTVGEAGDALAAARRELARAAEGIGRLAAAGAHPLWPPTGDLNTGESRAAFAAEYGVVAGLQTVCALQVHVAVGGHERTRAVHNALRSYLPEVAALAANAPYYAGRDTGLASVRPEISGLLPRQGVPPAFSSWEALAGFMAWGRRGGVFPAAGEPWWEVRAHEELGTIELRVPDSQVSAEAAAGVLALGAGLVAWLAERYDAGEPLRVHDTIRIAENRWRALRHGLAGSLLDLDTGEPEPARARVLALIDRVGPAAERLGGAAELEHARALAARNGAEAQRALAEERGPHGVVAWLADAFMP